MSDQVRFCRFVRFPEGIGFALNARYVIHVSPLVSPVLWKDECVRKFKAGELDRIVDEGRVTRILSEGGIEDLVQERYEIVMQKLEGQAFV